MPRAVPLFQTVQPDGSVLFSFTGEIHAQGIIIEAGDGPNPNSDRRILWEVLETGEEVGRILGTKVSSGTRNRLELAVKDIEPFGDNQARITLEAESSDSFTTAVDAFAGTLTTEHTVRIIDGNQRSSFMRAHPTIGVLPPQRYWFSWSGTLPGATLSFYLNDTLLKTI